MFAQSMNTYARVLCLCLLCGLTLGANQADQLNARAQAAQQQAMMYRNAAFVIPFTTRLCKKIDLSKCNLTHIGAGTSGTVFRVDVPESEAKKIDVEKGSYVLKMIVPEFLDEASQAAKTKLDENEVEVLKRFKNNPRISDLHATWREDDLSVEQYFRALGVPDEKLEQAIKNFQELTEKQFAAAGRPVSKLVYRNPRFFLFEDAGESYHDKIGSDFTNGTTVYDWLSSGVDILKDVAIALDDMHKNNYVHRDLKNENVCVKKIDGRFHAKLIDFGFARKFQKRTMKAWMGNDAMGTPGAMAPEIALVYEKITGLADYDCDGKIDVYSFGYVVSGTMNVSRCDLKDKTFYYMTENEPIERQVSFFTFVDLALPGIHSQKHFNELFRLMQLALSTDPLKRPRITEFVACLDKLQTSLKQDVDAFNGYVIKPVNSVEFYEIFPELKAPTVEPTLEKSEELSKSESISEKTESTSFLEKLWGGFQTAIKVLAVPSALGFAYEAGQRNEAKHHHYGSPASGPAEDTSEHIGDTPVESQSDLEGAGVATLETLEPVNLCPVTEMQSSCYSKGWIGAGIALTAAVFGYVVWNFSKWYYSVPESKSNVSPATKSSASGKSDTSVSGGKPDKSWLSLGNVILMISSALFLLLAVFYFIGRNSNPIEVVQLNRAEMMV